MSIDILHVLYCMTLVVYVIGAWKFNMPQVMRLDITVDTQNISEGAYQILGHLRPEWKRDDVHIKVIYLNYSSLITFCIRFILMFVSLLNLI